ncbi:sunset domain-containing protein [Actinokineospora fastidiosa]|uniref:Uncharacterized protein n=1 Tax=Actinokineospora fastidiosa TaxID=1816 RepID=A0A918G7Z7_9PSEU|nr:hypothetical protein [Actinokineospora fastidiosa]GGS22688.1 hypothetical protein GCM10010171_14400 [Actinokineospora fastidiosa]
MPFFGQVWLWSLAGFLVGALLCWALVARPARRRVIELEDSLADARSRRSEPVSTAYQAERPYDEFDPDDYPATKTAAPALLPGFDRGEDSPAERHDDLDRDEPDLLAPAEAADEPDEPPAVAAVESTQLIDTPPVAPHPPVEAPAEVEPEWIPVAERFDVSRLDADSPDDEHLVDDLPEPGTGTIFTQHTTPISGSLIRDLDQDSSLVDDLDDDIDPHRGALTPEDEQEWADPSTRYFPSVGGEDDPDDHRASRDSRHRAEDTEAQHRAPDTEHRAPETEAFPKRTPGDALPKRTTADPLPKRGADVHPTRSTHDALPKRAAAEADSLPKRAAAEADALPKRTPGDADALPKRTPGDADALPKRTPAGESTTFAQRPPMFTPATEPERAGFPEGATEQTIYSPPVRPDTDREQFPARPGAESEQTQYSPAARPDSEPFSPPARPGAEAEQTQYSPAARPDTDHDPFGQARPGSDQSPHSPAAERDRFGQARSGSDQSSHSAAAERDPFGQARSGSEQASHSLAADRDPFGQARAGAEQATAAEREAGGQGRAGSEPTVYSPAARPDGAAAHSPEATRHSPAARVDAEPEPTMFAPVVRPDAEADPRAGRHQMEPEPAAQPAAPQAGALPKRVPKKPGDRFPFGVRTSTPEPKPAPTSAATATREPAAESEPDRVRSLFEPVRPADESGAAKAPVPPPSRARRGRASQVLPGGVDTFVPPGPFGPGSAMPLPGGNSPSSEYRVKASVTALRYCSPESPKFDRTVAEVWFRTVADAERVGFRPLA